MALEKVNPVHPVNGVYGVKEMAIRHALKATEGDIAETANQLQIGRDTLCRR